MPILREGGGCPVEFLNPRPQRITTPNTESVTMVTVADAQSLTNKTLVGASLTQTTTVEDMSVSTLTVTSVATFSGGATITGQTPISITASTVTLGASHVGRVAVLNRAAGIAATLPAATGSGNVYTLIIGTTFTGAASIAVADSTDYMIGTASLGIDGGTAVPHQYPTANTGTLATESDTISLFGTANSQGGIKGQRIILTDIATDIWHVNIVGDAGGTEATPFSAAV